MQRSLQYKVSEVLSSLVLRFLHRVTLAVSSNDKTLVFKWQEFGFDCLPHKTGSKTDKLWGLSQHTVSCSSLIFQLHFVGPVFVQDKLSCDCSQQATYILQFVLMEWERRARKFWATPGHSLAFYSGFQWLARMATQRKGLLWPKCFIGLKFSSKYMWLLLQWCLLMQLSSVLPWNSRSASLISISSRV